MTVFHYLNQTRHANKKIKMSSFKSSENIYKNDSQRKHTAISSFNNAVNPKTDINKQNSICDYCLDLINDFWWHGMQSQHDNTLDLSLTFNLTPIQNVDILPGLGDHDVVSAEGLSNRVSKIKTPESPSFCKGRLGKSKKYAKTRNRSNQNPNPALKTKTGNN